MSAPWVKFYTSDWRADPSLRMCSLAARGLWMEMLCVMHEAQPYGSLLVKGQAVTKRQLASLAGATEKETVAALKELEDAGVFSRDEDGTVFSRRMRRDVEKAERDKANGKLGGNPHFKRGINQHVNGGDNPDVKAQKPEARDQKERKKDAPSGATGGLTPAEADAPPSDPDARLFWRGKQVLGKNAGGLIAELKRSQGGSIAKTQSVIELASTKQDAREYVGKVITAKMTEKPYDPIF